MVRFVENAKIEPCLFCGRKTHQCANLGAPTWYWIKCSSQAGARNGCGAEGPKRKTAAGAIAAWNRVHLGVLVRRGPNRNIDDYDDD